jgi:hypothetical protein
MYVDVPTKVSAIELMSSPETPKSQIFISPCELQRMFEGLMSKWRISDQYSRYAGQVVLNKNHHVMTFR